MTSRRQFLTGLIATGLAPTVSWADAGAPAYLAAAARPDDSFVLCGISAKRDIIFQIPLPARGHAAAAHPVRPEAVAFARRPGTFAVVVDCMTGKVAARLTAQPGRHFYGHGVFSLDGAYLYTTENDYEAGQGVVGVWDAQNGYDRLGEFSSGGVGPHDIKRLPGTDTLVIANGGIDTHPETGRTKLNIPTMQPNLSYIDTGTVSESVQLDAQWHKNSIRHLDVRRDGTVALGMQWQGDRDIPPLVGLHHRGNAIALMDTPDARAMDGYIGSVAFSGDGAEVVVTSPRGGRIQQFSVASPAFKDQRDMADACGVAAGKTGTLVTTGLGEIIQLDGATTTIAKAPWLRWDNHLIALGEPA